MKSKKVTSKDVAKEAGVSQSAVSMILNKTEGVSFKQETVDAVWEAVKKLNYQPNSQARSMKTNRANSVGLLSLWEATSFVFSPVMEGLQSVCNNKFYSITLCTGEKDEYGVPDYVQYYLQNRIDGLIFISQIGLDLSEFIENLNHYQIPFVSVIGGMEIDNINVVNVDLYQGAYSVTKHLIEVGYKKITYIEPYGDLNIGEARRIEGYKKALKDFQISYERVYKISHKEKEKNIADLRTLLQSNDMDAFVACHTFIGYLVLTAAHQLNIHVPNELGIICCDHDNYASYTAVPLSTADVPLYDMGSKAGEILFQMLDRSLTGNKKIEIPSELSIRESVKKQT